MAKGQLNKYLWLVKTIYQAERITLEEINSQWARSSMSDGEVFSRSTFNRYRLDIEELFDILIECQRKGGYHYYIKDAENLQNDKLRNWLLDTLSVNSLTKESNKLKERILFEQIPSGRLWLAPIIEAMRDSMKIKVRHQGFWSNSASTYTISPYCVKIFRQRWYVIAYTDERKSLRTFALDRIISLESTNEDFRYPDDFSPEQYFSSVFGIIKGDDTPIEEIEIITYGHLSKYIEALPLHPSQKLLESDAVHSVFTYNLRPTFDFRVELLSHGDELEVLKPQSLREEMKNMTYNMSKLYEE